jgi:signal transduction histidine kinase
MDEFSDDPVQLLAIARRAAVQAATLQHLTAALSSTLSEEQVGAVVLREALPAFGATAGDVVLLDDDDRAFRVLCWMGYPEHLVRSWMRYPVDTGTPGGDVVRSAAPVFLDSFSEWAQHYPRVAPIIGQVHLAAYAGLPLVFGGRLRGVVSFNFPEDRSFSPEERAMLLAFAAQCAQSLERARLFSAEQRARLEAESAMRAKGDFLAVMSHELRTPLTSILGYQELLADGISGPVTELQRQHLSRIEASALHLLALIDELLTFSRLEAGRESVKLELVRVATILDSAAALVAPLATAKSLPVVVEPVPALGNGDLSTTTDCMKLQQVLVNLLSNAIKFTERGQVTMSARAAGDDLMIDVRDTGIGIAAEHLDHIFEPFSQVEQHSTRRAGGTGLGLSVSRQLLVLLGGSIGVESALGQGSVFHVRLPLTR